MISPRYIVRFILAFFARFKGIIFFSVFIGIVFFLLLSFIFPKYLNKKTEKIGVVGKYTTDNLPLEILRLVSSGLTAINPDGSVSKSLSDKWETADGGKTWKFHIKEGVFWQDGKSVDSSSINYEFSDAQFSHIDSNSLEFKLQTPFSAFPVIVSKPVFKKGLLGTGEWQVKNINLTGGYVNKLVLKDKEGNKKIYTFYPTEERLKTGFKLGEVDIIKNITDPTPFNEWKTADTNRILSNWHFIALFLNNDDQNLIEKNVRQALNYAIDKNDFPGERALSSISPESWAYNPQVKPYEKDIERAVELLGKDGKIKIVLSTPTNLLDVAENIKKQWTEIDVETEIQVITTIPQNYQAFLAIVDVPKDPDQYVLWHSTQNTNIAKYKSPRIDKLIEDGRTQLNIEERKKIYLDFQRFLVEDCPAIFLYHPNFYEVKRK